MELKGVKGSYRFARELKDNTLEGENHGQNKCPLTSLTSLTSLTTEKNYKPLMI
jgi:hypothetical protein